METYYLAQLYLSTAIVLHFKLALPLTILHRVPTTWFLPADCKRKYHNITLFRPSIA
jgi:hypothetical protein